MSDVDALTAALTAAATAPAILDALARACWHNAHDGADCPDDAIPSESALCEWLPDCPPAARASSCAAALATGEGLPALMQAPQELRDTGTSLWSWTSSNKRLAFVGFARSALIVWWEAEYLHAVWLDKPEPRPRHPLAPIVAAWLDRPREVEAETRPDKRILPHITGGDEHSAREVGMLFAGLHENRRIEQPELPLWEGTPGRKRVPVLDVVDAAGVLVVQRGGAPIPLRLFVRTLSAVPMGQRGERSTRLAVKLGDLLDAIWPKTEAGVRGWRPGKHWPELQRTLELVSQYAIHDGKGRWFPLALRYMPDSLRLDDDVVLDVAFPPGAKSGPPVVLPVMDRLMVQSAARWRAFIAAHCIAWIPGTTRVPVMRVKRKTGRHTWVRDVDAYPVLTLEDRRRLAFGSDPHKVTIATVDKAFRDLPGLVVLDEAAQDERHGEAGFRIVPEAAATAIGRKS